MNDHIRPAIERRIDPGQNLTPGPSREAYRHWRATPRCVLLAILITPLLIAGRDGQVPASSRPSPQPIPIIVHGDEQARVDMNLADGGLRPVAGAYNVQVHRSAGGKTKSADGEGWTYKHQVDLAVWKGRMYAVWAMGPVNEIEPEYKLVYSTSTNGIHWSAPADLFPREIAWYCRFYFYRAANGRMLAFCPYKSTNPRNFFPRNLLVREITADHRLGRVFTLINLDGAVPEQWAPFTASNDAGFVAACREAAGSNLLLEQQDLGSLLGERRMAWHSNPAEISGWKFGKAFCFYRRADHALVGMCKMGYVTVSEDNGRTWSQPEVPPTLFAGAAKIWGQRTADGRFALVYNPAPDHLMRWPLVLVHGDDGREFRDMRVVHGEVPRQRYSGGHKDIGAQYVRGVAEWANDGTLADKEAMWLIYSVNKEDIWVARVPLPVKPDETAFPSDDFERGAAGGVVPGWNVYSPLWAPVTVVADGGRRCLELRDGDPFDYARVIRGFPESARVRAELAVRSSPGDGQLEIDLCDAGGRRPVRVLLTGTGVVKASDGGNLREIGKCAKDAWTTIALTADLVANRYTVQLDGGPVQRLTVAEEGCAILQRLSLRTGPWRGREVSRPVDPAEDVPLANPAVFRLDRVAVQPLPDAKR